MCNEPFDEVKEIDETDDLEPEIEEYFEDFYQSSGGSYSPFPSQIFALLFFLVHSPYPLVGYYVFACHLYVKQWFSFRVKKT